MYIYTKILGLVLAWHLNPFCGLHNTALQSINIVYCYIIQSTWYDKDHFGPPYMVSVPYHLNKYRNKLGLLCLCVCLIIYLYIQSNLLMWSPLLRGYLSLAATFSWFLEPKCSVNEPVLRGHLS